LNCWGCNDEKYLYVIASLLLFSGIAYAYYGGSSGVMTDTNCNQAQYFNIGVLCQDADDGKLYKGTGSAIEQIQAYDADLDIWAGITPSTDVQAFLGAANDTAARTELGLGSLATQNADNVTITGGSITGLTTLGANTANVTQLYTDHIGETTGSHGVVFDNNVDINSGTINGTTIGGTTPAAGTFTTLNADNVTITGGSITGIMDLTVGGAANVTTLTANVIKTDTSADATLSGTPIIITVYDAASNTPYYFKAYPTK